MIADHELVTKVGGPFLTMCVLVCLAMLTIYNKRPKIDEQRQRKMHPEIVDKEFWEAFEIAKPYSLLNITGFYNIFTSVRYIAKNKLPGDFIECGVYLGGSAIFTALIMRQYGLDNRRMYALDTYAGFPPGSRDKKRGVEVKGPTYASFREAVQDNFSGTLGPRHNIVMVEGDVMETLPRLKQDTLAFLRLDTDFYDSTHAGLKYLYDRLVRGGVLIVDDYGYYEGARRATDELLARLEHPPLLNRIDPGVWAGVKP